MVFIKGIFKVKISYPGMLAASLVYTKVSRVTNQKELDTDLMM